jgi:hypothetical protein
MCGKRENRNFLNLRLPASIVAVKGHYAPEAKESGIP